MKKMKMETAVLAARGRAAETKAAKPVDSTREATAASPVRRERNDFCPAPADRPLAARGVNPSPSPNDWKFGLDLQSGAERLLHAKDRPQWTKFTVVHEDPGKTFFQNVNDGKYPFHYEFATQWLEPFKGMTRDQFNEVALGEDPTKQRATLGAVLVGPGNEIGVQLVGASPLSKERVVSLLTQVKASIQAPPEAKFFYFPTTQQAETAKTYAGELREAGFPVSDAARWAKGNQTYAMGWALGRLKFVPSEEIEAKYTSGELTPSDILVTDAVPAEVPFVAGILSLTPATPNSHVNILAESWGVPFGYLADPKLQERVRALDGQLVRLSASKEAAAAITLESLSGLSEDIQAQVLALKAIEPLDIPAKTLTGKWGGTPEELANASVANIGGKASNFFDVLTKSLPPENVREPVAFTFDVEAALMKQLVPSTIPGKERAPLGEEIAFRLKDYQAFPPADLAGLRATLSGIRDLIASTPFSEEMKDGIKSVLLGPGGLAAPRFNPDRPLRFRSSSNVEDAETFTGAGLYASHSGRLRVDLESDEPGSPGKSGGVYRAMARTLASFYNDNAFLERRRYGVKEADAGMAILTHYSSPGLEELANGVATAEVGLYEINMMLASQKFDEEIANPAPGAPLAEMMSVTAYPGLPDVSVVMKQASTHKDVEPGAPVLGPPDDKTYPEYRKLASLLQGACEAYIKERGLEPTFDKPLKFDLEYELAGPGPGETIEPRLVIKQIRPVPVATGAVPTLLVPGRATFELYQGESAEAANLFGLHAQKCRLSVESKATWFSGEHQSIGDTLFDDVTMEYVSKGEVKKFSGKMSELGGHLHHANVQDGFAELKDEFENALGQNTLSFSLPSEQPAWAGPMVGIEGESFLLETEYDAPLHMLEKDSSTGRWSPTTRSSQAARLMPAFTPDDEVQERVLAQTGKLRVTTRYRYAAEDTSVKMKTRPLASFESTTIEGLTPTPIVLRGYFSQTMEPEHHNFAENFLFEPRLDPDLTPEQRKALEEQDIVALAFVGSERKIQGKDGKWRNG